jgi:hypothetical protein
MLKRYWMFMVGMALVVGAPWWYIIHEGRQNWEGGMARHTFQLFGNETIGQAQDSFTTASSKTIEPEVQSGSSCGSALNHAFYDYRWILTPQGLPNKDVDMKMLARKIDEHLSRLASDEEEILRPYFPETQIDVAVLTTNSKFFDASGNSVKTPALLVSLKCTN